MDIGMIIGSVIAILTMFTIVVVYMKKKGKKETLSIVQSGNKLVLRLGDNDFFECNISDIKNDEQKVHKFLKEIIQSRAKKISGFVDKVVMVDSENKKREEELLNIILSARDKAAY